MSFLKVSVFLSGIVDNIPYVASRSQVVLELSKTSPALAVAVLCGRMTLVQTLVAMPPSLVPQQTWLLLVQQEKQEFIFLSSNLLKWHSGHLFKCDHGCSISPSEILVELEETREMSDSEKTSGAKMILQSVEDFATIVKGEIDIVKKSLTNSDKKIGSGIGFIIMAFLLMNVSLLFLLIALAYGLIQWGLPSWASFLLVSNPMVAEAAVVGANDELTGQSIVAFVILRQGSQEGPETVKELRNHVAKEIGAIAKPKKILIVAELPKTRSGKIMRRLLRDVAENRSLGDVTTLADPTVMNLVGQGLSTSSDSD